MLGYQILCLTVLCDFLSVELERLNDARITYGIVGAFYYDVTCVYGVFFSALLNIPPTQAGRDMTVTKS